jgi:hypothetical protein
LLKNGADLFQILRRKSTIKEWKLFFCLLICANLRALDLRKSAGKTQGMVAGSFKFHDSPDASGSLDQVAGSWLLVAEQDFQAWSY